MAFCSSSAEESGFAAGSLDAVFLDRKSTRLNSSHLGISYAVFCLIRCPRRSTLFPYTTLFRSHACFDQSAVNLWALARLRISIEITFKIFHQLSAVIARVADGFLQLFCRGEWFCRR